jgi:hypothetical protein
VRGFKMQRRKLLVTALVLSAFSDAAHASDTTFLHPKGFALLVPDGWTTDSQNSGVNVAKSPAYVGVFVFAGNGSPRGLMQAVIPSIAKSWKNFAELRESDCTIAGVAAVCSWYSGIDNKGVDSTMKIGAFSRDGNGYMMFTSLPALNTDAFARDADRIERSLSFNGGGMQPGTVTASGRAQLAALDDAYQNGLLGTEEYETNRKALMSGQPIAVPSARATPPAAAPSPAPAEPKAAVPSERNERLSSPLRAVPGQGDRKGDYPFQAFNRSFATRIPAGWKNLSGPAGLNGTYFFGPEHGGEERIILGSGPLLTGDIEQLAASAATLVTTMFPALRLAGRPRYGRQNGLPVAELVFGGAWQQGSPWNRGTASLWRENNTCLCSAFRVVRNQPLSRTMHARLLRVFSSNRARTVVFRSRGWRFRL